MSVTINGTNGLTFTDSSTQNTAATGFGFKNRILNGNMTIDQRNAGASGTATGYNLDRWTYGASQASKGTWQQNAGSVTPPAGFTKYWGFTSSSAYSVGSGDYFRIMQVIEGFNIADLAWGTANAATVTLSFKVYSSLTGTFGGCVQNATNARSYPFTYTISSANTWTTISITIAGDTTGTWAIDNTGGMYVQFGLGVGATYSGTAGSWASANYVSATGATSVVGTSGATFYITGVQLEKGSTATSFDYRPYGTELQLCQRYYEKSWAIGTVPGTSSRDNAYYTGYTAAGLTTGYLAGSVQFKVTKRASPTVVLYDDAGTINVVSRIYFGISMYTGQTGVVQQVQDSCFTVLSSGSQNAGGVVANWTSTAEL